MDESGDGKFAAALQKQAENALKRVMEEIQAALRFQMVARMYQTMSIPLNGWSNKAGTKKNGITALRL